MFKRMLTGIINIAEYYVTDFTPPKIEVLSNKL